MFLYSSFYFFVVPTLSPINVTAIETSGKSINISWKDIPYRGKGGIILGFVIYYNEILRGDVLDETRRLTVNVTFHYELQNLLYSTGYNISVAGFTNAGVGVKSNVITAETGLSGKSLLIFSIFFLVN